MVWVLNDVNYEKIGPCPVSAPPNTYGLGGDDDLAFGQRWWQHGRNDKLEICLRNDIVFVANLYVVLGVDRLGNGEFAYRIRA